MGCVGSRQINSEEDVIQNAELGLEFNQVKTEDLDLILRKFSFNNKLNQGQLERCCGVLGFRICNYATNSRITEM